MRSQSLYRVNTSWLQGLLFFSLLSLVMFLLSCGILIINIIFWSAKQKDPEILSYEYDTIAFPIILVSSVFLVFCLVYFIWNYITWIMSYIKSPPKNNDNNRKLFNFVAILFGGIIILTYIADLFIKAIGVVKRVPDYFGNNPTIYVFCFGWQNWEMLPFFLMTSSFIGFVFFLVMHFLQIKFYKSEIHENSRDDVQEHYRNIESKKQRKSIKKYKQKDLSKKIRVF